MYSITVMNTCERCGGPAERAYQVRYCSQQCSADARYDRYIARWLAGETHARRGAYGLSRHVRRFVLERAGYACEECGWNDVHPVDGRPLIQVDHANGDPYDNDPTNLRALCPNCHAKTEKHGGRNRGFGRWRTRPDSNGEPTT